MRCWRTVIPTAVVLLGCEPEENGRVTYCDAERLTSALSNAAEGETVVIGQCPLAGSFTVRPGVTLAGESREASVIVPAEDQAGVVLVPGSSSPRVRSLRVESTGRAGILVMGPGTATVEEVDILATRGIGIGAQDVDELLLSDVTLLGPITPANAQDVPDPVSSTDSATHGLVLVRVGNGRLEDLSANGFAAFGALILDSTIEWDRGTVSGNLGTGLLATGGGVTIEHVDVCDTLEGFRLIPSFGAVFTDCAVSSTDLEVCRGEGFGIVHDEGSAHHVDLIARDNDFAAVWVQRSTTFDLSGASEIADSGFAGVVVLDTADVVISGGAIGGTRGALDILDDLRDVTVGDGIQLRRVSGTARLEDLTLSNNERVGVLIDFEGVVPVELSIDRVSVDGEGDELGAVLQGGKPPQGWDSGITRSGATAANDETHDGSLDVVEVIGPNDMPDVSAIADQGLDALLLE